VPNASSVSRAKSCLLLWGMLTMLHLYETKERSVLSRRAVPDVGEGTAPRSRARSSLPGVFGSRATGCNTDQWHGKKNPRCGIVYTNAL